MDVSGNLEKDPVCDMMVNESENQLVYRGVGYSFCSQQCRERFTAAPGLYVGHRGSSAPKQKGMAVIKRRCIELAVPLPSVRFAALKDALMSMMGVIAVHPVAGVNNEPRELQWIEGQTHANTDIAGAEVTYDLLQATAMQLERKIVELDTMLSNRWGERLVRDFIHYLEQCELDDLAIRDTDRRRFDPPPRHAAPGFDSGVGPRNKQGTRVLAK